jgi:hypothetical protein
MSFETIGFIVTLIEQSIGEIFLARRFSPSSAHHMPRQRQENGVISRRNYKSLPQFAC